MHTKVMIIGAGPYGISLAYELWQQNVPFIIAGYPFSLWFKHTLSSMSLRSDRHTSEIFTRKQTFDLTAFIYKHYPENAADIIRQRIPNDVFRAYLLDVLKQLPYAIQEQKVISLSHDDSKDSPLFSSTLEDGTVITSEHVVIASGIEHHKELPPTLQKLPEDKIKHSWHVEQYESWKNKHVLVIGGGQSAAEGVAQLMEHNQVTWVLRRSPIFYSEPINLPKPIFTLFLKLSPYFYFMPTRLKDMLGKKFVQTTITPDMQYLLSTSRVKVVYKDAEHLQLNERNGQIISAYLDEEFDGVVAATGYDYQLNTLTFIQDDLQHKIQTNQGVPQINFEFETSVPGLYFVGGIVEQHYGPAQRFMMGSRHATMKLGKVLTTHDALRSS